MPESATQNKAEASTRPTACFSDDDLDGQAGRQHRVIVDFLWCISTYTETTSLPVYPVDGQHGPVLLRELIYPSSLVWIVWRPITDPAIISTGLPIVAPPSCRFVCPPFTTSYLNVPTRLHSRSKLSLPPADQVATSSLVIQLSILDLPT